MAPDATPVPRDVDVQTVKSWLDAGDDFLLLDCREQDEYNLVHIPSARHIPMGDIPRRVAELQPFRDQRIVVHCHHGGRSLQVTNWLRGQGFSQTQNMQGGIDQWSVQVDPALPRYG